MFVALFTAEQCICLITCIEDYVEQIVTEQLLLLFIFFKETLGGFFIGTLLPLLFPGSHHITNEVFAFKGLIPAVCLCTVNHTVSF